MKKQKIRIFNNDWSLAIEDTIEIPESEEERLELEEQQKVKDYLYSISLLRWYGTLKIKGISSKK